MRKIVFAAMAVSALCCMGASYQAAAQGAGQDGEPKFTLPHITVAGSSFIEVKPDVATLYLGVVNEKSTAAAAASENAKGATAAIAMLKDLGIEPKDIKTTSLTISPVFVQDRDPKTSVTKRTLTGYSASNSIEVRIRDIDKAGVVASRVVEAGANNFRGIVFSVSDRDAREDNLRAQAVREAMRRAALYSSGASMKLGRLLAINPDTTPDDNGASLARSAATTSNTIVVPVEPGVVRIDVRVSATWELVPQ
ncbi:SIMPL domain-containing protein [Roseiarcaceae bacterium H3SJ34-1]|uniref:SIMPL domain-containing protein n=1 Tax=Terripilifer ovatus TaxID=3032367 RepID=UPI003AB95211|nr:SIMPL domain-containing protein [Roseiarcaceae bacterium H3SJ34-1]